MAIVEIHLKDVFHWILLDTEDIITARSKNIAHIIIDSPKATVRIRLSAEEAASLATNLTVPPNL